MDETRRAAEAQRAEILAAARAQADTSTAQAAEQLAAETAAARTRIEHEADALASAIAERVLGRRTT
jgi:F0F1-type ATP synthase membrane subunit b/b'